MSQAAHESNWGNSGLTQKANNLFGYTANDSWKGDVLSMSTTEYSNYPPDKIKYWNKPGDIALKEPFKTGSKLTVIVGFRKYEDWDESCKDWGRNISNLPRYSAAYQYAKLGDLEGYARAVSSAGYASDPNYAQQLINVSKEIQSA
jgi:flagellum-specific peptidoglycan hydrolase FlgJ